MSNKKKVTFKPNFTSIVEIESYKKYNKIANIEEHNNFEVDDKRWYGSSDRDIALENIINIFKQNKLLFEFYDENENIGDISNKFKKGSIDYIIQRTNKRKWLALTHPDNIKIYSRKLENSEISNDNRYYDTVSFKISNKNIYCLNNKNSIQYSIESDTKNIKSNNTLSFEDNFKKILNDTVPYFKKELQDIKNNKIKVETYDLNKSIIILNKKSDEDTYKGTDSLWTNFKLTKKNENNEKDKNIII